MKNPLHYVLLCIVLLIFQHSLSANELYPVTLTERVNNSTVVAEGKVISQSCFIDPHNNNIYTSNRVMVYRLFKGTISTSEIEVITHGGVVGNRGQAYSSYLQLYTGQTGIFFCMPSILAKNAQARQATSYMVYSSMQGFIAYDAARQTAADPFTTYKDISLAIAAVKRLTKMNVQVREYTEIATNGVNGISGTTAIPTISSISPTTITAGTGDILTITGTGFNAARGSGRVLFRNPDNGGAGVINPLASDYISWTDTEIQVRVPSSGIQGSGAGSGIVRVINSTNPDTAVSPQTLIIPWSYTNLQNAGVPIKPVHFAHNGARGGYTFQLETNFAANTAAKDAFARAMQSWICATQMNWNIGEPTTIDSSVADLVNVVRFEIGNELAAGVLGLCISNYYLCGTTLVTADIDIIFDNQAAGNFTWQYGPANPNSSQVDFESVSLHELGHAQQLGHVILPGAVMHYAFNKGQLARNLSNDDINGGNYVTSRSFAANACGLPPMTPGSLFLSSSLTPPGICSQNSFVYTPTSGSGNTYNWTRPTVAGISNSPGSGSNGITEILENTTSSPVIVAYNYSLTKTGCPSGAEVVAVVVNPVNTLLAGTAGGPQVCASYTVLGTGTSYSNASCDVIAKILPSGASPVTGSINVCSKYESSVPSYKGQAYCSRHYDIEPALNPSTSTGTVTLYYTQAEFDAYNTANGGTYPLPNGPLDASNIANIRITQFHGTSVTGVPGSYSGSTVFINPVDGNITWNAMASRWEITFDVTGFSGFFVHTGLNALPLHLLQFSGTVSGNSNLLQWTTAAEQNTDHFDVERSADGTNFTTVAKVTASGSTVKDVTYKYSDDVTKNLQPQYYYRLKMVDKNNQFTYSATVLLKRNNLSFLVKALQNPFHQQLQVNITSPKKQNGVITLTAMNGSRLSQKTVNLPEGTTVIDIPGVNKLSAGTYVLTLVTDSEKKVIKVLKQQ
jgi:hypothetical protein